MENLNSDFELTFLAANADTAAKYIAGGRIEKIDRLLIICWEDWKVSGWMKLKLYATRARSAETK